MSGPTHRLAEAVQVLRTRTREGALPRQLVTRQLGNLARELLRRYPADPELWRAFENLRDADFALPPELILPSGDEAEVLQQVWSMTGAQKTDVAKLVLELPQPSVAPKEALALLELLLAVPSEEARVRVLVDHPAMHTDTHRHLAWNFRACLAFNRSFGPFQPEGWAQWLDDEAAQSLAPRWEGRLLRMGACQLNKEAQIAGLVPLCDGRVLGNWGLATWRRPALRELSPKLSEWMDRAAALDRSHLPPLPPMEKACLDVEEADAQGEVALGTQILLELLRTFPDDPGLRVLGRERARLLMDPALLAHVEGQAEGGLETIEPVLPALDVLARTSPAPPADVIERVRALGATGTPKDAEDLNLLEALGDHERATLACLDQGDPEALAQAARIVSRGKIRAELSAQVEAALRDGLPPDEEALAQSDTLRRRALWLASLLPAGPERHAWALRLDAASLGATVEASEIAPVEAATEDPHAPANRIAAAEDLLAEGHADGAAAIAIALVRRPDWNDLLPNFLRLVQALFRGNDVPLSLVEAIGRHIRSEGLVASPLLEMFRGDARAAHPILGVLHSISQDDGCAPMVRLQCLQAWLNVWRATATLPADDLIRPFMRRDGELLILACAMVAGHPAPVATAATFLAQYPPLEHPPSVWAQALLDMQAGP